MSRIPLADKEKEALQRTVDRYASLAADLQDVIANGWPSHEQLKAAPILDAWMHSILRVQVLEGSVIKHPELEGWIQTSPVYAMSLEAACFRTQSRWYRLGEKFVKDRDEKIIPTCEIR